MARALTSSRAKNFQEAAARARALTRVAVAVAAARPSAALVERRRHRRPKLVRFCVTR